MSSRAIALRVRVSLSKIERGSCPQRISERSASDDPLNHLAKKIKHPNTFLATTAEKLVLCAVARWVVKASGYSMCCSSSDRLW
jgi:hypothetical protein